MLLSSEIQLMRGKAEASSDDPGKKANTNTNTSRPRKNLTSYIILRNFAIWCFQRRAIVYFCGVFRLHLHHHHFLGVFIQLSVIHHKKKRFIFVCALSFYYVRCNFQVVRFCHTEYIKSNHSSRWMTTIPHPFFPRGQKGGGGKNKKKGVLTKYASKRSSVLATRQNPLFTVVSEIVQNSRLRASERASERY